MPYDIILCLVPLRRGPSVTLKLTVSTELTGPTSCCHLPVSDPSTRVIDICGHAQPFRVCIRDSDRGT